MEKRNNLGLKIFILTIMFVLSFGFVFADPSIPPPPPPITSYTYTLMDEFRNCGPADGVANFCTEYYSKQKVVANAGSLTISPVEFVCGKDSRCTAGIACTITNPVDNNKWKSVALNQAWICPDGFGVAQIHAPGVLNSNFDTVSFSFSSIVGGNLAFKSNTSANLYFNAYIPACVNRIPMMNFNPKLNELNGTTQSSKVGLYAKHETLDYDANPSGGKLENFYIPEQNEFRKSYILKSDLKTYRMWSYRESFVDGLQKTVLAKSLSIPGNINVDGLPANMAHDYPEIYYSKDFMLGAYRVNNSNNVPVGTDINQELKTICNINIDTLGLYYINNANDLNYALYDPFKKNQIISKISSDNSICHLTSGASIADIKYLSQIPTYQTFSNTKTINFDFRNIRDLSSIKNSNDFISWSYSNMARFSKELRNDGILNSNPQEEISTINSININEISTSVVLDRRDFSSMDNSTQLKDYIAGLNSYNYPSFSTTLSNKGYIQYKYLIKNIGSINILDDNNLRVDLDLYTRDITQDVTVIKAISYDNIASVELKLDYITSTESSWNWRSLESLTLTQLSKCLYNWDSCLFNTKSQAGVGWQMSEVADLGYGPIAGSMAYIWSKQSLESEFTSLTFGYHFDGARGDDIVNINLAVYKTCDNNKNWSSSEGFYACTNSKVYKCFYGVSLDELELGNVFPASLGDTLYLGSGHGYVCAKNDADGIARWKEVDCNI